MSLSKFRESSSLFLAEHSKAKFAGEESLSVNNRYFAAICILSAA
jgi:hypothetical protein